MTPKLMEPSGPVASTHREVVQRLAGSQKDSKGAPAYSRFINRPVGRQCAAVAFRVGLTPNTVTAISGLFSFAGIAVVGLVRPHWWTGVLVAILLMLGYALDSADGQLARLRGGASYAGEWLDHMIDAAKISSLHLMVLVGLFRFTEFRDSTWLLVPVVAALIGAVLFFGTILNDQLRRRQAALTGSSTDRGTGSTLRSILVIPTDYGLLCLIFVLLGSATVFLVAYAVITVCTTGYLLAACPKWFREMSRLGAS